MNSKVNRTFAVNQIRRLSGLRSFPTESEAVEELVTALMIAPSADDVVRFVNEWISENIDAPRPAEIYTYFKPPVTIPEFTHFRDPDCPTCSDSGFESVERNGFSYARPCPCRKKAPVLAMEET